ncbi:10 kDa heat shock protein [Entophlyctis luteolus]|nr:10 kDa heat shock protein [Entophlyctis luteolus]KAJ3345486.1 10 kDa heat shock protein [Entophlyctis luteolus]KAJ3380609.1 10 kDa heat shock protein [Entophlyctis sp. JEL0112]
MSSASAVAKKIAPLFDRVLIQRVKAAERTASGLFIPEKAQETLNEGLVVATGPGGVDKACVGLIMQLQNGNLQPIAVQVGDKVLLPAYGGSSVKLAGEEYLLFTDKDILAKLL